MNDEKSSDAIVKQPTQPLVVAEKKKNMGIIYFIGIIALVAIVVFGGQIDEVNDFLNPTQDDVLELADVELYKFIDVVDGLSLQNEQESKHIEVNVELWVINLGDETAKNISVFVRVRDHNGKIIFSENLHMTALVLRTDETCSGTYTIKIDTSNTNTSTKKNITHTIEIMWSEGRNSYQKETIL